MKELLIIVISFPIAAAILYGMAWLADRFASDWEE